jgi:hypothetical protein
LADVGVVGAEESDDAIDEDVEDDEEDDEALARRKVMGEDISKSR